MIYKRFYRECLQSVLDNSHILCRVCSEDLQSVKGGGGGLTVYWDLQTRLLS